MGPVRLVLRAPALAVGDGVTFLQKIDTLFAPHACLRQVQPGAVPCLADQRHGRCQAGPAMCSAGNREGLWMEGFKGRSRGVELF